MLMILFSIYLAKKYMQSTRNNQKEGTVVEHKYLMDVCKEYIGSEKFPGYAIWLNGAWGCGKTFLCQKVKEEMEETALSIWYISLFGVKSIEEIDDKLFEAAHPLVSEGKTGISMLYKISRVAVKHKFNVDIKDIGDVIPGLLKKEPRTCRALIVDDVERSKLKPDELFGYFSSLLDDGIRIIFVGNEAEYMGADEKNKNLYNKTKEKLIGNTYEVPADFENAVNAFIKEMELSEELKEPLHCVVEILKVKNLRIIKQCLYGWNNFYANITNSEIKGKKEYIEEIFEAYIVFMSQYKSGELLKQYQDNTEKEAKNEKVLLEENLGLAWVMYKKYNVGVGDEKVFDDEKKNLVIDKIIYTPVLPEGWPDIVINGRAADKEWLNKKVTEDFNKRYPLENKGTSLDYLNYQLQHPIKNKHFKIDQLFLALIEEFEKGKYVKFKEVELFVALYVDLLKAEILPKEYNSVYLANLLDTYIGQYGERIEPPENRTSFDDTEDERHLRIDDESIKSQFDRIIDIMKRKEEERTLAMFSDKAQFFEYIEEDNYFDQYNNIGIMRKIDVEKVFSWLKDESDFSMDYKLLRFLKSRYGKNVGNRGLHPSYFVDLDNVKKLCGEYEKRVSSLQHKFNLSKRQYGNLKKDYEELIKYMEKEIETEKQKRESVLIV